MIRSLLLILILSVITSGCSREESSTKDELILGLIIGYAVNYYNPCKDGRPYMEVNQGDLVGPFTSQKCFHLTTTSAVTITVITTGMEQGCLDVYIPQHVNDTGDDPSITVPTANGDLWAAASCYGSSKTFSVQF